MNATISPQLYFLEQCCVGNGVPPNCLGLCVEDNDASLFRFSSFCDKYQDVAQCCDVLPTCKFDMNQHKT